MMEHPVSYAIRLVTMAFTASTEMSVAWRRALYLAAAGAGAIIVWYGYRFGWPILAAGLLLEAGDWLLCHLPYEPLRKHDSQTPWL